MAEKLDATSRLAEGLPAVDNIQNYVWACHLIGYQCPDLTLHASQVRDWYGSEDGLDLSALAADCASFERVVAATEQALLRQDDQIVAMSAAWSGYGADASREFLRRHGEASAAAAAAVRTAAEALASLRDRLWHTVDGKVATALAVEDRVPQRAEWLAAAHTVMTGAGDRAEASELVDQQVKPFVDNDIRAEWLAAMRSALAAVADSYEAATAELSAESAALFDVPGDLGPSWTPPPRADDVATTPAAASPAPVAAVPASWSAPPAATPMATTPMPATPPLTPPPASPLEPTAPAMAPTGSMPPMGGGIPDIGSGLSGFGQQLADTLGGLVGSADDALADAPGLGEEPDELDELDELEEQDELDKPAEPEEDEPTGEPIDESATACQEPPAEAAPPVEPVVQPPPPPEPAPTPAPLPPPPEPLPPPEPVAATATPCEIAADELPQVGE